MPQYKTILNPYTDDLQLINDISGTNADVAILKNNEYEVIYYASIGTAAGTITTPTGATIILGQFPSGLDAIVETIVGGFPSGNSPTDAFGNIISVTSFDNLGNFVLSGTPSSFPVALVYLLKIKAIDWQNLDPTKIVEWQQIAQNEFFASEFRVKDNTDPTKKIAFIVSSVTGTRFKTWQDTNGTVAELTDVTKTLDRAAQFNSGTGRLEASGVSNTALSYITNLSSDAQTQLNAKEPTITGGTNLQYWRGDKTFQTLDTSVVPENGNLYYTQGRFDAAFAAKSTTDLSEGSNLYYTQARFDTAFAAKALDDLSDVAISSPVLDQFLRYNGTNWVNGNIITVNAGAGIDFYPATTASDIGGYNVIAKTPQNVAEQDLSATANNNSVLIQAYATASAGLGGTQIEAGEWIFDIWGYVDVIGLGFSSIDIKMYSRTSGGVETLLFTVNSGTLTATDDIYSVGTIQQAFALSASTDRLVMKVYATTTAVINRTVHFVFGGTTHYSNVATPFVIRHNDVSGLQGGTASEYYHLTSSEYTGTGTGTFVRAASPTITGHPTVEGVTSTGATGTGKFVFDASPTITGHPTIEGITSTGATGTGKFVFDNAPTITGHPTIEGVTSTGATGTGKFVFDTSPTLSNPVVGTQASGDNSTKAASTAYADAPVNALIGNWYALVEAQAQWTTALVTASDVYFLTWQGNSTVRNGVGSAASPAGIYLKSTDYPTINGKTAKLRIKVSMLAVNDVAPGTSFTVGLYPITAPTSGTTGAVGVRIYNNGTVVTGSNGSGMVFTTPAADSLTFDKYSAVFAFPADGFYAVGASIGAALATNSSCHIIAELQIHYE